MIHEKKALLWLVMFILFQSFSFSQVNIQYSNNILNTGIQIDEAIAADWFASDPYFQQELGSVLFDTPYDGNFIVSGGYWTLCAVDPSLNRVVIARVRMTDFTFWVKAYGSGEFSSPKGAAIDANLNVYVCDSGNNRLVKLNCDIDGNISQNWTVGGLNNPHGIDIAVDGTIWVADRNNHRLVQFSSSGSQLQTVGGYGSGDWQLNNPQGVETLSSPVGLIIADTGNDRVVYTDLSSDWDACQFPSGAVLTDVAYRIGEAYITDDGLNAVHKIKVPNIYLASQSVDSPSSINNVSGNLVIVRNWSSNWNIAMCTPGLDILNLQAESPVSAPVDYSYILTYSGNVTEKIKQNGSVIRTIRDNSYKNSSPNSAGTWDLMDDFSQTVSPGNYELIVSSGNVSRSTVIEVVQSTDPTIVINAPNGGEIWSVGESQNILWQSQNFSGNVKIEYSTDNGDTWTLITSNTADDGMYAWTIPNEPSNICKIKISDASSGPATDRSNNSFKIRNPSESISVTSPQSGETYRAGDDVVISWTETNFNGHVSLMYSIDEGNNWIPIIYSTDSSGQYTWTSANVNSERCVIKVSDAYYHEPFGLSAVFNMERDPFSMLTFLDDFEDGDTEGWTFHNASRWTVGEDYGRKSMYINTSNYNPLSGNRLGEYALVDGSYCDDFLFTCKARTRELIYWDVDYAIIFGYQDENNYYYMYFTKAWASSALYKVVGGVRSVVVKPNIQIVDDNQYHDIEIRRTGEQITVKFDGNQILSTTDNTFLTGMIGVGSLDDKASFDNVAISQIAQPADGSDQLFEDDFEDGVADGWSQNYPARWTLGLVDGSFAYYINTTNYYAKSGNRLGEYALIQNGSYSDFSFACRAKSLESTIDWYSDLCLIFGYQDDFNYYYMYFTKGWSLSALYKVIAGESHLIAKPNIPLIDDSDYHDIKIIRVGHTITIKFDGITILFANDATYGYGLLGVGSVDDKAAFDNIVVYEKDPEQPYATPEGFEDNFQDHDALGWTPLNANRWIVGTDGSVAYYIKTTNYYPLSGERLGEYSLIDSSDYNDFRFTCKARSRETTIDWLSDFDIIFGYQDENNYYYMYFTKSWSSSALYKVVNGTASIITKPNVQLVDDLDFHDIEIQRVGHNIIVKFDNYQILNLVDSTFANGQIGVGSRDDAASFDNILITETNVEYLIPPSEYVENFEDESAQGWVALNDSRWTLGYDNGDQSLYINTSNYQQQSGGRPGEYVIFNEYYYGDFSFSCDVRSIDELDWYTDYCLIFGYQSENNYYLFKVSKSSNYTGFFKVVGGQLEEIQGVIAYLLEDNNYHNMKIIRSGKIISIKWNNYTVINICDETFGSGKLGFGSFDNAAAFDNIVINVADPDQPQATPDGFFDDFEDSDYIGWSPLYWGRWNVGNISGLDSKALYIINANYNPINWDRPGEYALVKDCEYHDFTFRCRVQHLAEPVDYESDYCIIFGYQDGGNYYYMRYGKNYWHTSLSKIVNGQKYQLLAPGVWIDFNADPHQLEINYDGQVITAKMDNYTIFNYTDPNVGSGKIGVGAYNDKVAFDDVFIESESQTWHEEFADDFQDGNANGWEPRNASRWTVGQDGGSNAYYINTSDYSSEGDRLGEYSVVDGVTLGDFKLKCDVKTRENLSVNTYSDYAIVYGYQDDQNYYNIFLNSHNTDNFIYKIENGTRTTLASTTLSTVTDNNYHAIEVQRLSGSTVVKLDNNTLMTAEDFTFTTGKIGFGSFNDAASIDNVHIYSKIIGKKLIEPENKETLPLVFELHHNYPNPFNPYTKIKFDLPEEFDVSLKIYDILGREINTLVDKKMPAGFHEFIWDGMNKHGNRIASGVYIMRIIAGKNVAVRKMILMK